MNDQDLTSGLHDFFSDDDDASNKGGGIVGGVGAWILHLVVFAFAIYSGYHGISATAAYHAANGLGQAAGIMGIIVIELVLVGLYLAYFNRRITGSGQKFAAAATAGLGFVLSCLGIIGDSQMNAGMAVSPWLSTYLTWFLPIAPAIMALGAAVVMATDPKLLRNMAAAVSHEEFEEKKHAKRMAAKGAELKVAQNLANMQLNGREQAARYVLAAYRTPEVQSYIQRAALAAMPDLMRSIGVDLPYGTIIDGTAIDTPTIAPEPEPEPAMPARASWLDRLRGRKTEAAGDEADGDAEEDQPAATNTQPRPEYGAVTLPELQELIDRGLLHVPPLPQPVEVVEPVAYPNGRGASANGHH